MRVVFAKHEGCDVNFAFFVPKRLIDKIQKGTVMIVSTRYGDKVVTATTGVIEGNGAADIAIIHGATFPLKKVRAIIDDSVRDFVLREHAKKILNEGQLHMC